MFSDQRVSSDRKVACAVKCTCNRHCIGHDAVHVLVSVLSLPALLVVSPSAVPAPGPAASSIIIRDPGGRGCSYNFIYEVLRLVLENAGFGSYLWQR